MQRAPRQPRRIQDTHILDRVRQLENALLQMKARVVNSKSTHEDKAESLEGGSGGNHNGLEDGVGRLIIDDENTRYISGCSWTNLADQVIMNSCSAR